MQSASIASAKGRTLGGTAGLRCRSLCNTLRLISAGSWEACRSSEIDMAGRRIVVSIASAMTCSPTRGNSDPLRRRPRCQNHNPHRETATASHARLDKSSTDSRRIIREWQRYPQNSLTERVQKIAGYSSSGLWLILILKSRQCLPEFVHGKVARHLRVSTIDPAILRHK